VTGRPPTQARGVGTDTQQDKVADGRVRDTLVVAFRRVRVRIAPGEPFCGLAVARDNR
jgi:hypothetical protein